MHRLDWLIPAVLVICAVALVAAQQHPGWHSRPAPADPAMYAPATRPSGGLDMDRLERMAREVTVKYREIK